MLESKGEKTRFFSKQKFIFCVVTHVSRRRVLLSSSGRSSSDQLTGVARGFCNCDQRSSTAEVKCKIRIAIDRLVPLQISRSKGFKPKEIISGLRNHIALLHIHIFYFFFPLFVHLNSISTYSIIRFRCSGIILSFMSIEIWWHSIAFHK